MVCESPTDLNNYCVLAALEATKALTKGIKSQISVASNVLDCGITEWGWRYNRRAGRELGRDAMSWPPSRSAGRVNLMR